jgi:hypothetical protein
VDGDPGLDELRRRPADDGRERLHERPHVLVGIVTVRGVDELGAPLRVELERGGEAFDEGVEVGAGETPTSAGIEKTAPAFRPSSSSGSPSISMGASVTFRQ